jgi:hypothetical protein
MKEKSKIIVDHNFMWKLEIDRTLFKIIFMLLEGIKFEYKLLIWLLKFYMVWTCVFRITNEQFFNWMI